MLKSCQCSRAGRTRTIAVCSLSRQATRGWITVGGLRFPCALGRSGRRVLKREGDGATPVGRYRIVRGLYRADRMLRPRAALPLRPIRSNDGWCDAPDDRNYNRAVTYPYKASAERLRREDHLYDVVLLTSHNQRPRIKGAGSAIFVHHARQGYSPTEGCIALKPRDLRILMAAIGRSVQLLVPA